MRQCAICGSTYQIEKHHLLSGVNRKKADYYGLVVDLCHNCHQGTHADPEAMKRSKQAGQRKFERTRSRTEFIAEFGQNYLWEEER